MASPSSVPKFASLKNLNADKKEPIKGVKKAMVKTMTQSNSVPHFSYCDEFNVNALVEMRGILKEIGKERGLKISYLPIFIKVSFCWSVKVLNVNLILSMILF